MEFVQEGFCDDLVKERYCDREDILDVIDDLKQKDLDVVRVGERYFLAFFNGSYYRVETDIHCFSPGCVEVPIFKIKEINGERGSLIVTRAESKTDSPLVQGLYDVVKEHYKKAELAMRFYEPDFSER